MNNSDAVEPSDTFGGARGPRTGPRIGPPAGDIVAPVDADADVASEPVRSAQTKRSTTVDEPSSSIVVEMPKSPPTITPDAARVLLRVLLSARDRQA
jgi:hypothetical protein